MGGLNLITGTATYLYNIFALSRRRLLSKITAIISIFMALVHLLLWMCAIGIYLGYVEEEQEDEEVTGMTRIENGYIVEVSTPKK